jgi:RNA polymerase sigma-70 factor (ECF subfamily)
MTSSEANDLQLLERWRAGDAGAGNQLVRRHFSRVFRFFRSKLDRGAEDLAQQTFLAVVEGRDRIRDGASFKGYVFGIARRQLLLVLRKRYRRPDPIDLDEMSMSVFVDDSDPSPSHLVAQRQEQRLLIAALRTLPIDYQIALELHYWEEMGIADIAAVLDASPGTIKSRLSRGRSALGRAVERMASQRGLVKLAGGELGNLLSTLGTQLGRGGATSAGARREGGDSTSNSG